MSYPVFPTLPGLAWSVTRSPIWKTRVAESASGIERRVSLMSYPRYKYQLSFEFLRVSQDELQTLIAFVNTCAGSGVEFLYTDPNDHVVTDQVFGVGDGTTKVFQLMRAYGGYVEPVSHPLDAGSVTVGGVAYNDVTVSDAGVATLQTAPAVGVQVAWTGTFAWVCRFLKDSYDFEEVMAKLFQAKSIDFQTVKH